MSWMALAASAAISWGLYGASLHRGQTELGNPLRAMLCVGIAYFLIAVLVPVAALSSQGELRNFNMTGTITATVAGALGALGAVCITYAFRNGGSPTVVMPLVFGGAPLINVISTMIMHPPKTAPSPMFYVGVLMAAAGAGMVLYYRPAP
jgi:drug/metabolite transporter (DMT)-like permease